jgi:hypothetical protein
MTWTLGLSGGEVKSTVSVLRALAGGSCEQSGENSRRTKGNVGVRVTEVENACAGH